MYPEELCSPMRQELVSAGFIELKTSEDVDSCFEAKHSTLLIFVNSVCGCAAGSARPAIIKSMKNINDTDSMGELLYKEVSNIVRNSLRFKSDMNVNPIIKSLSTVMRPEIENINSKLNKSSNIAQYRENFVKN